MTTIAYDGRFLAADTLGTCGGLRLPGVFDKMDVREDGIYARAYAHAGNLAYAQPLMQWHETGAKPDNWPVRGDNADNVLIVARLGGVVVSYEGNIPHPGPVLGSEAWGTGAKVAMGAMAAGLTAPEAVAVAMSLDLCTGGGKVQVIDLMNTRLVHQWWHPADWLKLDPAARRANVGFVPMPPMPPLGDVRIMDHSDMTFLRYAQVAGLKGKRPS